tara:strand:- start:16373 stop:16669 length:297 start_codon:yes stop_codon:yes gene_type:complete
MPPKTQPLGPSYKSIVTPRAKPNFGGNTSKALGLNPNAIEQGVGIVKAGVDEAKKRIKQTQTAPRAAAAYVSGGVKNVFNKVDKKIGNVTRAVRKDLR